MVLGDEVISAYERIPLSVLGDGIHTIEELLDSKAVSLAEVRGRACKVPFGDPRIEMRLERQGYTYASVPSIGEIVYMLDHANLSSGGDAVDVTGSVSPEIERLCIEATAAMGLRLCGVDIILDGDIRTATSAQILEVNSSPGLDNYATIGSPQQARVLDLYTKVPRFIEKGS